MKGMKGKGKRMGGEMREGRKSCDPPETKVWLCHWSFVGGAIPIAFDWLID